MEHQKDQEPPVPAKVPSDFGSQQEPEGEEEKPSMQVESRPQSPLLGAVGGQLPPLEEPSVKLRYTLDDDGTDTSEKRTRVLTQRGFEYQLTMKRKALKQAIKAWQRKADEVQDTLIEMVRVEEIKRQRDEITELFSMVERVHEDLTILSPEEEHVIDSLSKEHRQLRSEINLKLKELVYDGSQSRSKYSRSHRSSHSSRSTKSLRLETATKAAELAVRLKYCKKEAEKDAEAEKIKLEKDLEITKAKLKVIEEEQQSEGSPSQLPEEDPHDRVQSFLDAMPVADPPKTQHVPLAPVQSAVSTNAQFQGATHLNPIPSQTMLVTDGVSAPLLTTSYATVVTGPTTTEQLTQMTTTRSAVIVPTSVSATTTSFVTSHSQASATVTSQMMPSLPQPTGDTGPAVHPVISRLPKACKHRL